MTFERKATGLSGRVIYIVARYLNARRGIDVAKRFAEIPVE